jgi:hypothetical protein
MSPERAQVDGRDYGTPGPQSMFALTNSVRTALVAGTVSITLSAARPSQLMASACNERNSVHSIELRFVGTDRPDPQSRSIPSSRSLCLERRSQRRCGNGCIAHDCVFRR